MDFILKLAQPTKSYNIFFSFEALMHNICSLFFTNVIKFRLNELTRNSEFEFEKHTV